MAKLNFDAPWVTPKGDAKPPRTHYPAGRYPAGQHPTTYPAAPEVKGCEDGRTRDWQSKGRRGMSAIKDGGPAFPRDHANDGHNGMTLRDYFAAQALPLAFAVFDEGYSPESPEPDLVAKCAYQYADAMLAARETTS